MTARPRVRPQLSAPPELLMPLSPTTQRGPIQDVGWMKVAGRTSPASS